MTTLELNRKAASANREMHTRILAFEMEAQWRRGEECEHNDVLDSAEKMCFWNKEWRERLEQEDNFRDGKFVFVYSMEREIMWDRLEYFKDFKDVAVDSITRDYIENSPLKKETKDKLVATFLSQSFEAALLDESEDIDEIKSTSKEILEYEDPTNQLSGLKEIIGELYEKYDDMWYIKGEFEKRDYEEHLLTFPKELSYKDFDHSAFMINDLLEEKNNEKEKTR